MKILAVRRASASQNFRISVFDESKENALTREYLVSLTWNKIFYLVHPNLLVGGE